jgi:hypothetical protein
MVVAAQGDGNRDGRKCRWLVLDMRLGGGPCTNTTPTKVVPSKATTTVPAQTASDFADSGDPDRVELHTKNPLDGFADFVSQPRGMFGAT